MLNQSGERAECGVCVDDEDPVWLGHRGEEVGHESRQEAPPG